MPTPEGFRRNIADKQRMLITAVDGFAGHVRAHFNPKEVSFDKKVNWNEHKASGHNEPYYEYTSGAPRTMTMELLFDRFEIKDATVDAELECLQRMTMALDPKSKNEKLRRPPLLEITNGPLPKFRCVLESLAVKVIMFNADGRAVRATANVTFKELRLKDEKVEKPNWGSGDGMRDGHNWQKPSPSEEAASANKEQQDRDRIDKIRYGARSNGGG